MDTRRLGTTDLDISRLGFGAWAIGGGGWKFGWGSQEDRESIAAIHRALDLGVNWIDTAPVYGVGTSEEIVGKAIADRSERPYVFTKCGLLGDKSGETVTNTLQPDSIRREVEDSLRRLGIDVIDLYQIHWPDPDPEIEEAWATLAELKQQGKVRHIGVSNFSVEQMERVAAIHPIASLQPQYSLVVREVEEEVLPYCAEHEVGVIAYSPMMSGLLTGAMTRERVESMPDDDWRKGHPEFQEPQLSHNLELVEILRGIGERRGASPGAVAIAWVLRRPEVTGAIVGSRRPDQFEGIAAAADLALDDDELAQIAAHLGRQHRPSEVG
jgi:aryl-alcohol dehydrogenase-like predicted oxidoreductase